MNNYRQPTEAVINNPNHDWQHWETIGDHHIWCRGTGDYQTLWQVTAGNKPTTTGGYYNKSSMLKLKGIA